MRETVIEYVRQSAYERGPENLSEPGASWKKWLEEANFRLIGTFYDKSALLQARGTILRAGDIIISRTGVLLVGPENIEDEEFEAPISAWRHPGGLLPGFKIPLGVRLDRLVPEDISMRGLWARYQLRIGKKSEYIKEAQMLT